MKSKNIRLTAEASILAVLTLIFGIITVAAQAVPMKARDVSSAVDVSSFEKINLSGGSITFSFPITTLKGRGPAIGFVYNIESRWRRDEIVTGYSGANPNVQERIGEDPYALRGVLPQVGGYLVGSTQTIQTDDIGLCSNEATVRSSRKSVKLNFTGFGGSSYNLISAVNDGEDVYFNGHSCNINYRSIGTVFVSTDGSGTKFIADSPIQISDDPAGEGSGSNFYPSGDLKMPDGTTFRIDGGLVSSVTDRNGNRATLVNTGFQTDVRENRVTKVTDALNREITVSAQGGNQNVGFKGFGGSERSTVVSDYSAPDSTVLLNTLFPWIPSNHPANQPVGCNYRNFVELPNSKRYTFTYNCYGEVSRIDLPTGGAIEYDYASVSPNTFGSMERRLTERRVYADGTNLESRTTYSYSSSVPTDAHSGLVLPEQKTTTIQIFDRNGVAKSHTKSYFHGCFADGADCILPAPNSGPAPESAKKLLDGMPFRSEVYSANGSALLKRTDTVYEPRTRTVWPQGGNSPYRDYRVASVTSTLVDSGQVSKVVYGYDPAADFNSLTDTYDFDYGAGQPGAFIRRTHTDFDKSAQYRQPSVNLLNLPKESWVSSDMAGNLKVSRTIYEYDVYSTDQNHAPLVDRNGITGRASGFGTGFLARGNQTRMTSFADAVNQTGAVSVYSQYDIAGNVVKTIDGNGNAAIVNFSDNFGGPDAEARTPTHPASLAGQFTFAFASSRTNAAGYVTFSQFDYHSGQIVDAEDELGNVASTLYDDRLDRPTKSISSANRSTLASQTSLEYDDDNRRVIVTSDSKALEDNAIKSIAHLDGLGRNVETHEFLNQHEFTVSKQEFDSMSRVVKTCFPYRPDLGEQPLWTSTKYDELGRVTEIKTPDNAKVTKQYWGSSVRVFDQAGRSRAGVSDAFGRIVKVVEYDNGADLETNLVYDALGKLRKSVQGAQARYFMFDDLGRLIRSKHTEQQANPSIGLTDPVTGNSAWSAKMEYDRNGNIVATTDSRNITIFGTYDVLNRLRVRDYSDATPDVSFTYDDPTIPNSRGKLTKVTTSVSESRFTSFDELGRITSSSFSIEGRTWSMPTYRYDLSGTLIEEIYPSGRVVRVESDLTGRISKVASRNPNQTERTMLGQISYNSTGAVTSNRLGNGRWETMDYDAKRLQLTKVAVGGSIGDASMLQLEYRYSVSAAGGTDNNGALRSQKITVPGISAITQDYEYDLLNRISVARETVGSATIWRQGFVYDRYGNKRFDPGTTTTLPADNAIFNPSTDPTSNRFATGQGYLYDTEGNVTAMPDGTGYAFNADNKTTHVLNPSGQVAASYSYDGNGLRVKKTVGNQETFFVYDAFGKLVAEYVTNQSVTPTGTRFLTTDVVGSPRLATNNLGNAVSRHDYLPFGEEISAGVANRPQTAGYAANDGVRQQFAGYQRDVETGLDFAQARFYSSRHGRFTSVDPLTASANAKNPQTFNRYSYALNSPYKFIDPLGLAATQRCWGNICVTYDADEKAAGKDNNKNTDAPEIPLPKAIADAIKLKIKTVGGTEISLSPKERAKIIAHLTSVYNNSFKEGMRLAAEKDRMNVEEKSVVGGTANTTGNSTTQSTDSEVSVAPGSVSAKASRSDSKTKSSDASDEKRVEATIDNRVRERRSEAESLATSRRTLLNELENKPRNGIDQNGKRVRLYVGFEGTIKDLEGHAQKIGRATGLSDYMSSKSY